MAMPELRQSLTSPPAVQPSPMRAPRLPAPAGARALRRPEVRREWAGPHEHRSATRGNHQSHPASGVDDSRSWRADCARQWEEEQQRRARRQRGAALLAKLQPPSAAVAADPEAAVDDGGDDPTAQPHAQHGKALARTPGAGDRSALRTPVVRCSRSRHRRAAHSDGGSVPTTPIRQPRALSAADPPAVATAAAIATAAAATADASADAVVVVSSGVAPAVLVPPTDAEAAAAARLAARAQAERRRAQEDGRAHGYEHRPATTRPLTLLRQRGGSGPPEKSTKPKDLTAVIWQPQTQWAAGHAELKRVAPRLSAQAFSAESVPLAAGGYRPERFAVQRPLTREESNLEAHGQRRTLDELFVTAVGEGASPRKAQQMVRRVVGAMAGVVVGGQCERGGKGASATTAAAAAPPRPLGQQPHGAAEQLLAQFGSQRLRQQQQQQQQQSQQLQRTRARGFGRLATSEARMRQRSGSPHAPPSRAPTAQSSGMHSLDQFERSGLRSAYSSTFASSSSSSSAAAAAAGTPSSSWASLPVAQREFEGSLPSPAAGPSTAEVLRAPGTGLRGGALPSPVRTPASRAQRSRVRGGSKEQQQQQQRGRGGVKKQGQEGDRPMTGNRPWTTTGDEESMPALGGMAELFGQ